MISYPAGSGIKRRLLCLTIGPGSMPPTRSPRAEKSKEENMEVFSVGGSNTNGEVALVIAGIHGSELSGIEVARWLFDMLTERWNKQPSIKPYYTTVIIPEIYPESAKLARMHSKNPNGWLKDLQTTDPILWEKAKYNVDNVNWAIGREVIL